MIYIEWTPGHNNIFRNSKADEAAKYRALYQEPDNIRISYSFIKRKLKERAILEWTNDWNQSKKGSKYEEYYINPKWKANPLRINKILFSSILQLKLGHGYFLSYLNRFNNEYESDICNKCSTGQKQTPYHLIFQCPKYKIFRKDNIDKLDKKDKNLFFLFSKYGINTLIEYLKQSNIATRRWILGE